MSGLNRARVRVLYYVAGLEVGGTEKIVHDLALALPRSRFDVTVIWSCCWGPLGENLRKADVPVSRLPLNRAAALAEVAGGIREIQPDIFHSFSYRKDDRDVRAATLAGVPIVLTARRDMRHWDAAQTCQDWELFRNQRTQRITVCSQAVADLVQKVEGVAEDKIRVIHNGVGVAGGEPAGASIREELGIGADHPLLGYVANYRPEKGHETLLRAFRRVLDVRPAARLICCGGGPPEVKARLAALAADLGLDGHVFLLDLQLDTGRIYRALDVYVHASDTEGFSNSLLEAMERGLPIVATRVGGNPEAIRHDANGLLAPPRDCESLSAAVLALLDGGVLAGRLGKAAAETVRQRFQFHHMLNSYTQLYEEELARR